MTANAFVTVSLDPLLLLTVMNNKSRTFRYVRRSRMFTVNILSNEQVGVARRFADPNRPVGLEAFNGIDWFPAPHSGSPVLSSAVSFFDCTVDRIHKAGDHWIVVGLARAFGILSQEYEPLLFVNGRFGGVP